ncbi:MAG TPA: type II toxin-antitoxin system VapC family toxin [Tepidisphaeraceae bacterium]|nr:type II toxin-antitoxin system VapC family toxin [Tepidisphaeraceae bacterium]
MSDWIVDSSVVAKWILPETDSAHAQELISEIQHSGGQLIVLDLAFPEVANAIWKRHRQKLLTADEAREFLGALSSAPVRVEAAMPLLPAAMDIAVRYDRAIYDALFVALSRQLNVSAITADEPLYNVVHSQFPQIVLLKNWKPTRQ